MASMKDWLGFSQSPQELPPSQPHQSSTLISGDEVSADCHALSTDPQSAPPLGIPTLRPASHILEALNRPDSHPQDWSMNSLDLKGSSSELSILVGSRSNQNNMDHDKPKLEGFLGGNSFSDHDQKLSYQGAARFLGPITIQVTTCSPIAPSSSRQQHQWPPMVGLMGGI